MSTLNMFPSTVVIWKINNYNLWCNLENTLYSPSFEIGCLYTWKINLYPYNEEEDEKENGKLGVYLCRESKDITNSSTSKYLKYSIQAFWNKSLISSFLNCYKFKDDEEIGDDDFISLNDISKKSQVELLDENQLVICCKIWEDERAVVTSVPVEYFTSNIPVKQKYFFDWCIESVKNEKIESCKTVHINLSKNVLTLTFSYISHENVIKIVISGTVESEFSFVCCCTLAESGEVFLLKTGEITMNDLPYEDTSEPSISYQSILENSEKHLISDSLVLNCDFSVLGDEIETTTRSVTVSDLNILSKLDSTWRMNDPSLQDDMKQLYQKKELCDFTLQVESKSFPAHSALLAARSPVFERMLETNMKEKKDKSLNIEDLDGSAVSGMLKYIYLDDPGVLDFELALKLYYAGDKYEIQGLKKTSSDFLKDGLTAANVPDVLEVADKHNDEDLVSFVLHYIFEHEKKISKSSDFQAFCDRNPRLAAQTWMKVMKLKYKSASEDDENCKEA